MSFRSLRTVARRAALAGAVAAGVGLTCLAPARASEPALAPASSSASSSAPVAAPASALAPLQPIANLDLPGYMGRWYELARYPNRFQKQCAGAATADYTLLPAGTVKVVNRCPLSDGTVDEAVGEARRVGPEGSATLQVRFAPAWLSFLPQVWGDYWVLELDAAYRLAVVGEPRREFLWILSREPSLPAPQWAALNARLQALGFEPERLIRSAGR